jgi:hypothetical protein
MKEIVFSNDKYLIFEVTKINDEFQYAKVIASYDNLIEAKKIAEDAVPANCVGGGGISGLDIGYTKKKKYKFIKRKYK